MGIFLLTLMCSLSNLSDKAGGQSYVVSLERCGEVSSFKTQLLNQLHGTFHFGLILAVPVDKRGCVSPNVRLNVPSVSLPAARRLLPWDI